ncbi:MAG: hypothetical protein Q7Q71_03860 [Verrucomicrobiota bacterium JB023]|nr:hypothetical protein [Verrucomicrobiota bacterium JB023]
MKKSHLKIVASVAGALALCQCVNPNPSGLVPLQVDSRPERAEVIVTRENGPMSAKELAKNRNQNLEIADETRSLLRGQTPVTFLLDENGFYRIDVTKPGYRPAARLNVSPHLHEVEVLLDPLNLP